MSELRVSANMPLSAPPGAQPLTQGERVLDTFSAPGKAFADILRDQSWWLPFLLGLLVAYGYTFAIQKQVGWDTVARNVLRQDPKATERLANQPPRPVPRPLKSPRRSFNTRGPWFWSGSVLR